MNGYYVGMGTTPGMWEMASECLDGENLPVPLNEALGSLREGGAVVLPRSLIDELLNSLNGWNGDLHFRVSEHVRGNKSAPPNTRIKPTRLARAG